MSDSSSSVSLAGGEARVALNPLLAKLLRYDALSEEEARILQAACKRTAIFPPDRDIVLENSSPTESCLLIAGFAARYKDVRNGSRQITALHIPGDFIDLHSFLARPMDHSIIAITECNVAYFPHSTLQEITEKHPHLTRILWLDTITDGAIHREWLVAMGRLSAVQHTAHFLCELFLRLKAVGLVQEDSFALPLTQHTLADAMGLSHVHMNRAIQALRAKRAITWQGGIVTIANFEALAELGEFDPTYLGQTRQPR